MITYETLYEKYKNNDINIINEVDKDGNIKHYKYKDVLEKAETIYDNFIKLGLTKDDTFLLCAKDGFNFTTYFLAIFKLNATVTLIEKDIDKKELNHMVSTTKVGIILTDTNLIEKFTNKSNILININNDNIIENKDIIKITKENDEAKCIIFSSGTTSKRSGVIHKTSNIYEMIKNTQVRYQTKCGQSFITIVPCSHIYGLSLNLIYNTYNATEMYYLENLDYKLILNLIKKINPDYLCGVAKMLELIENQLKSKTQKYNILIKIFYLIRKYLKINLGKKVFHKIFKIYGYKTCLITAGSAINRSTKNYLFGIGFSIIEFYGSTETGVPIICTPKQEKYTYGIGKVLNPCKIKINEKTGELLIKNKYCLIDYLESENDFKNIVKDGWISTGDRAKIVHGNVYIIGRIKETIVLSTGEKVSPEDVEFYYSELKKVKDFAVCGIPKNIKNKCDEIHIFIVKSENATEKEIKEQINQISRNLSTNKRIKYIHFVDKIPRTSINKPKRFLLKQQYLKKN